ncbi:MAG: aspartate aminotransferase family protein [Clostridiales bacterium]|jgi:aminotransferase, acetylornithine/succinylornithine family|nr:aspartate aminotransferase family protein [Clostridiales bacterium]
MDFSTLQTLDNTYVAHTYGRFPVAIKQGSGAVCTDSSGKQYLDFTAGIGVNSLGFCSPQWVEAVSKQAATLNHTSNLYYTEPGIVLAQKLCEKSCMKRVFFSNSGAEANEGAIKAARKYSFDAYGEGRYEIISLHNSFHGRTITTLAATGQAVFHTKFNPFTEGFVFAEANNIESVKALVSEKTCAVMLECIQGEGGVVPLEKEFVQAVAALCQEKDLLLIIDEVQTGLGRTGSFFSYQQFGVQPDIVSAAKGLGGGLPIGAVLFGEKTMDTMDAGTHGSTFGANPIVCAGANVVVDSLDDDFLSGVKEKSALIFEKVAKFPHVQSVTGLGLMIGVSFDDGITGKQVVDKCLENGVLFLTAKTKLRMLPPLTITKDEIEQGLSVLETVLTQWEG